MGVQLPTHRCKGAMQRARVTRKTAAGRRRYLGHWMDGEQPERAIIGELSGYTIERRAPKGHSGPVHPLEDRTESLASPYAGQAFGWWAGMGPEERERTIAGIVAQNADAQEKGKHHAKKRPAKDSG